MASPRPRGEAVGIGPISRTLSALPLVRRGLASRTLSRSAANTGPIVCACFGVGLHTLHDAIADERLTSVAEIGQTLRAGTNCGSCIPELKAILTEAAATV